MGIHKKGDCTFGGTEALSEGQLQRKWGRGSTSGEGSPPDSDHTASLEVGTEIEMVGRVLRQLRKLPGNAMLWITVAGLPAH